MASYEGIRPLRDVLVKLYPSANGAALVAAQAGLNSQLIDMGGSPIQFWHNILIAAQHNNQVQKIIDVARSQFPGNEALLEAERIFQTASVAPESSAGAPDPLASDEKDRGNAGGVSIGNVSGGISGAIIAGRDVNNATTGDSINVGDISNSQGIAIGRDAQAHVNYGITGPQLTQLFAPLLQAAQAAPPPQRQEAEEKVRALEKEVSKGTQADDSLMAGLIEGLVDLVPSAVSTVVGIFATPLLSGIAGNITKYVLGRLQRKPTS